MNNIETVGVKYAEKEEFFTISVWIGMSEFVWESAVIGVYLKRQALVLKGEEQGSNLSYLFFNLFLQAQKNWKRIREWHNDPLLKNNILMLADNFIILAETEVEKNTKQIRYITKKWF